MQKEKALRLKELLSTSRSRALADAEHAELDRLRRALHDGYILAQRLTLAPGQMQRRSRRVAHALKATVVGADFRETTSTMNLSSGGFAALLTEPPARHERVEFTLQTRLGRLQGKARAVSAIRRDRSWLASFAIDEMPDGSRQALDQIVFEQVVSRLPG
jgi:hypothetical protein